MLLDVTLVVQHSQHKFDPYKAKRRHFYSTFTRRRFL